MSGIESRERIKHRMVEEAIQLWGYRNDEINIDHFDPVVELIMSACASELERISHEIHNTRSRITERLVDLMVPDALTGVLPAHGILKVAPVESVHVTDIHDQFFLKAGEDKVSKEIYFSPSGAFKTFDGNILYTAVGNRVFQHSNGQNSDLILIGNELEELGMHDLWIGLEMNDQIHFPEGLAFYFDFDGDDFEMDQYQQLTLTKWWIDELPLAIKPGIFQQEEGNDSLNITNQLLNLSNAKSIVQQVINYYGSRFITIQHQGSEKPINLFSQKKCYPGEFKKIFNQDDLKIFDERIVWLKIQFPETFSKKTIENLRCDINCFPVINRRFHNQYLKLQPDFNILNLSPENYFFDLESVESDTGEAYQPVHLKRLSDFDSGTYCLRKGGVSKFDERDASEMLHNLLDQVRNESTTFAAVGYDLFQHQLLEVKQILARLEKNISKEEETYDTGPSLFIRPRNGDNAVDVRYWSSDALQGNRIPKGSSLEIESMNDYRKGEATLMTTTTGGRNKLNAIERVSAYRASLSTCDRIVTAEDVRALSLTWLGASNIKEVIVKKGVAIGSLPGEGLVRTIDVLIYPKNKHCPTLEEWGSLCSQLEVILKNRSSGVHPYKVNIIHN